MQTRDEVEGFHNCREFYQLPECLDEAMETRKKVLYYFYKIFLKDNSTNEGKCWGFLYFLIETDFVDTRSYFPPTNQYARLTTHNQSKFV